MASLFRRRNPDGSLGPDPSAGFVERPEHPRLAGNQVGYGHSARVTAPLPTQVGEPGRDMPRNTNMNTRQYCLSQNGYTAQYAEPLSLDAARAEVRAWVKEEVPKAKRCFRSNVVVSRTPTGARIECGVNLWGSIEIVPW